MTTQRLVHEIARQIRQNVFCATGPGGGVDPSCGKGLESLPTKTVEGVTAVGNPLRASTHDDEDFYNDKLSAKQPLGVNKTLDLSKIASVQRYVVKAVVAKYIADPKYVPADSPRGKRDLPEVIKFGDEYVVSGGNHRLAAAVLRGDKTARVTVYDVSDVK